ncbi:hypothetical protein D3Z53_22770 [Lachnospiraceae bacterium]|nr:hypothetical protein [Lachnospiraceae bacterium]
MRPYSVSGGGKWENVLQNVFYASLSYIRVKETEKTSHKTFFMTLFMCPCDSGRCSAELKREKRIYDTGGWY